MALKVDYDLAKQCLEQWESIEMVNELLYAILIANFSIYATNKCKLIQIVRDRHDAINHVDQHAASRMKMFLDRVDEFILRGRSLQGLSDEELKALQAPEAGESNGLKIQ